MRTIEQALAPYEVQGLPLVPTWRQFTPHCGISHEDYFLATWVIVYPGQMPLFLCEEHYRDWAKMADTSGTLGREAKLYRD